MTAQARDHWAAWVLERRDAGGDRKHAEAGCRQLEAIRDRVLVNADIRAGDVLLDVGTGAGLIAWGALERVGPTGRVVFSDVSDQLIEHCRRLAAESDLRGRCQFIVASADNLAGVPDGSVDVVTTRSVLVYVKDKARAFREFFRVLRVGGRLSIFEPINSFAYPEPEDRFLGYDVSPVLELATKVKTAYERIQPPDDPLLDFEERDLLAHAEAAGFGAVRLSLEITIDRDPFYAGYSRETLLRTSGNPVLPPLGHVLDQALSSEEKERFLAHLHPLVEVGEGERRLALAYLQAVKTA